MLTISLVATLYVLETIASPQKHNPNAVRINKCCEKFEILVDTSCVTPNSSVTSLWEPKFSNLDGLPLTGTVNVRFAVGRPDCGRKQMWPVYAYPTVYQFQIVLMQITN